MSKHLSSFDVFVICFNSAVGAGFLAIPWVFMQLGMLPSILMVVVFTFVSTLSAVNLTESVARLEALVLMDKDKIPRLGNFRSKKETLLGHEMMVYDKEV